MQNPRHKEVIDLETHDTDKDDAEDAIEKQESKITGVESLNEEKKTRLQEWKKQTRIMKVKEYDKGGEWNLKTHVISTTS